MQSPDFFRGDVNRYYSFHCSFVTPATVVSPLEHVTPPEMPQIDTVHKKNTPIIDPTDIYAPTMDRKIQIVRDESVNGVRNLHIKRIYTDTELTTHFKGRIPTDSSYDLLIQENANVYDHDTGNLIFKFRKNTLPQQHADLARNSFQDIDEKMKPSLTRNEAAGPVEFERIKKYVPSAARIELKTLNRAVAFKASGEKMSKQVCNPVNSYLAGYHYDRYKGLGYEAGFSRLFPNEYQASIPFFTSIYDVFRTELPDIHDIHQERCDRHRNLCIPGTNLTSIACNVNYESSWHKDRNDLKNGYSTLSVIEIGEYKGGYFVFAGYRIAVDVRERDVLLNQSHVEFHGNVKIEKIDPNAKRISFVTYLKKTMVMAKNGSGYVPKVTHGEEILLSGSIDDVWNAIGPSDQDSIEEDDALGTGVTQNSCTERVVHDTPHTQSNEAEIEPRIAKKRGRKPKDKQKITIVQRRSIRKFRLRKISHRYSSRIRIIDDVNQEPELPTRNDLDSDEPPVKRFKKAEKEGRSQSAVPTIIDEELVKTAIQGYETRGSSRRVIAQLMKDEAMLTVVASNQIVKKKTKQTRSNIKIGIGAVYLVQNYSAQEMLNWCKRNNIKTSDQKEVLAERILAYLAGDFKNIINDKRKKRRKA
jgi:hypothetical protein